MSAPTIGLMQPSQVPAAATALARAFQNDPLQSYVLPDPAERAEKSPAHFAPILAYGLRFGRVYTTLPDPLGAAVCLPPDGWDVTPQRAKEVGLDRLAEAIGEAAARRFYAVLDFADTFHRKDVKPEHWHVMVLGVAPEGQGRGLGRMLLQPILTEALTHGLPCYLETAAATNVPFYERLGFRVIRRAVEPVSKLDLWTFRRDPS